MKKSAFVRGVETALVGVLLLFALVPIYWMATSALKSDVELGRLDPSWFPESATLDQFRAAIGQSRILSYLLYSGLLAAGTAVVVVILGSLAAYAVTQWTFPGVGGFLGVTLFTQLLPQSAVLVPLYLAWKTLGLTGTLPGLGVAYVFLFLPVGVWMLVGFFQSLPKELTEAGLIDGAGRLRILFSIVLPVVRPALGAVAVYTVISCWGEFLFALVFLRSDHATSTVALASLVGEHNPNIGPLMAAATLVTLPPLIVFFLMQRQFIAGLTGGSSK